MTTLTIEIPDSERDSILKVVKKAGGNVLEIDTDDDLSEAEFKLLQESYKEALQIRDGKIKAIPASELWND
jgi:hypothetical protein